MSSQQDHDKSRKNDGLLKHLPAEVLLKARSTLVSLGGALKPKHEQRPKEKHEPQSKKGQRLKSSRSEPEFSEVRTNKHRSRVDGLAQREYCSGARPRPLSVGALKRYEDDLQYLRGSHPGEVSPMRRHFESSEDVCAQARHVLPANGRLVLDVQMPEASERPRKKLSFREPEIVGSGSGTLGRSSKLMGVNSLTRRPNRTSRRSDLHSSLDGLDSDLESQAMRIVRTVGQAFEVCHKMQANNQDNPVPSTSSAADEPASCSYKDPPPKESASECAGSESGGASTSKVVVEEPPREGKKAAVRPKHLDLLPPPPKKEGKRTSQQPASVPSINLPDLPECVTKVEVGDEPEVDAATPLSAQHQLKLLRERLEQQAQQTQAAVAQLLLLRDQLAAEQAARCEAQARTHQLLVHNKELLEHIASLVSHLQEREQGNTRPINAQQLTLLPQKPEALNGFDKIEPNGNQQIDDDDLINFIVQNSKAEKQNQNVQNNNVRPSFSPSPTTSSANANGPDFGIMTNDQIQNYLIAKFQSLPFLNGQGEDDNREFYQNSNAFPHIPPISSHVSNSDLASLLNNQTKGASGSSDECGGLAQAMSIGQSQNSLYSLDSSSKDSSSDSSSEDGMPYIMPLSHNATLKATGDDGRVRIIVPVSPSESAADVPDAQKATTSNAGNSLQVPGTSQPPAPITRSTSEKVPNRSDLMAALRAQWTRHTTK
ncbi:unnamed protein product, partial [Iphiclides podalirius]